MKKYPQEQRNVRLKHQNIQKLFSEWNLNNKIVILNANQNDDEIAFFQRRYRYPFKHETHHYFDTK